MHALYLHGFASSPRSAKGTVLGQRLATAVTSYQIVDLEQGDFTGLTMQRLQRNALAAIAALPNDGIPCLLIGSSLGGYLAAWLASTSAMPRVSAALLIAPAFGFTARWTQLLGESGIAAWRAAGSRPFFHHAAERELPLGIGFLDSCQPLPELPAQAPFPISIVHGRGDETVDHRQSLRYAAERTSVEIHIIDGDHRLMEPRHEELIEWCARDLMASSSVRKS